jgi:two-component system, cell cycle sensor histidine kinase PleC
MKIIKKIVLAAVFISVFLVANMVDKFLVNRITSGIIKVIMIDHVKDIRLFYDKNVFAHFKQPFANIINQDLRELKNNQDYNNIGKYLLYYSDFFTTIDIKILKNNEDILFAAQDGGVHVANQESFASPQLIKAAINTAWKNGYFYRIFKDASFIKNGKPITNARILQIFLPYEFNGEKLTYEIIFDVTRVFGDVKSLYYYILGFIFVLLSILYIVIYIDNIKSAKLLEIQHDINVRIEEDKKRAEEENAEKSKFLANISHELRTPLNAIIGFSDVIRKEDLGPIGVQQYKDYVNDINIAGNHLLSLINDILDFSKAEANKLVIEEQEVNLNKIIKMSMRISQPSADNAKVKLIDEIPKQVNIIADPKRLKQVMLNLLSNAIKFTHEDGTVTVKVEIEQEEKHIRISIIDTGVGIDEKDIAKAMSSFGQVDNKFSRKYEGTGLGLPLTKKLVELMNGKFHIESELGYGTTVIVTMPLSSVTDMENDI